MLDLSFNFNQCLDDFGAPHATPNKLQHRSKIRLGPSGVAKGHQKPPGCLQGAILYHLGINFEATFGPNVFVLKPLPSVSDWASLKATPKRLEIGVHTRNGREIQLGTAGRG